MGRSQESFNKKEIQKKKDKKRKEKEEKRLARKEGSKSGLDDMIAYVDEYGRITDVPPDPNEREEILSEDIEIGVPSRVEEEDAHIKKGLITYFDESKGFGFIKESVRGDRVYFHVSNLKDNVKEGNRVSFEIMNGPKGPSAIDVSLVK